MLRSVTIRVRPERAMLWSDVASRYGRKLPAFLAFAADCTVRYLREVERGRRGRDPVLFRLAERERWTALLKAAKQANGYLPRYVDAPIGGRIFIGRDLSRAIEEVERFLQEIGE